MTHKILVPEMGESVLEATVFEWYKSEGEQVEIGDVLVELETDKVNLEIGAKHAGILKQIKVKAGEDVQVGEVLGVIAETEEGVDAAAMKAGNKKQRERKEPAPQTKRSESEQQTDRIVATPLAKRVAEDLEVDLSEVSGSGMRGRVTREDVQRYLQQENDGQKAAKPSQPVSDQPVPSTRREERVKMSRRRRTIAKTLVSAQQNSASLTTFNEVDMTAVMDLRKRHNPTFQEQHGVKVGIASFFIKSSVAALKAFPRLNAEIDGDEIILKSHYDIGVAIGDEDGLVVPVLRDTDHMSFVEIEKQIITFVEAVQDKSLPIEDLRGGTFSVTNGGVYGSLLSTPILNPPQVGILGLHKIEPRPVAIDDQVVIRPMMYVALSYDHRIVDGREAVQFLVHVKKLVEDPEQLLLAG